MAKTKTASLIPVERIANRIYLIRGMKVMFDSDLADLYAVETKAAQPGGKPQSGTLSS